MSVRILYPFSLKKRILTFSWFFSYDKAEDVSEYATKIDTYTHLMVGTPDEHSAQAVASVYAQTHSMLHSELCFKNIQIAMQFPFIGIRLAPCVLVLELKTAR